MDDLTRLRGRIHALKDASMFDKADIAEAALDEALTVFKRIAERLNVLESRMMAVQGGNHGAKAKG